MFLSGDTVPIDETPSADHTPSETAPDQDQSTPADLLSAPCINCGDAIPQERLAALPEVTTCVACEHQREELLRNRRNYGPR
jgi:hypothetical protein